MLLAHAKTILSLKSRKENMAEYYKKINGICASNSTRILKNGEGQHLRRIILLHIEVITFNFHFPKIQNVFMFMIVEKEFHDP